MLAWPIHDNIKALRGFIGLSGYYRKFVKGCGTIVKPLTNLLQKDSFVWNEGVVKAFQELKEAMTSTLIHSFQTLVKSLLWRLMPET